MTETFEPPSNEQVESLFRLGGLAAVVAEVERCGIFASSPTHSWRCPSCGGSGEEPSAFVVSLGDDVLDVSAPCRFCAGTALVRAKDLQHMALTVVFDAATASLKHIFKSLQSFSASMSISVAQVGNAVQISKAVDGIAKAFSVVRAPSLRAFRYRGFHETPLETQARRKQARSPRDTFSPKRAPVPPRPLRRYP